MQYRSTERISEQVSLLGYGCMRFSRKAGFIDQEKAERELEYALERGINYFDTAYIYPGSEEALGKFIAKRGIRESIFIASKMPHYTCKSLADFDRIFDEQLKRLQTDYIDFYLIHMITSFAGWKRCIDMGVIDWIERKRASGQIRHIGFSYHGGREDFPRIVDSYDWEFCQIQLNYLDAGSQAGADGLFYAAGRGLGVIIMEPLRGGKLVDGLSSDAKHVFKQANEARAQAGKSELTLAQWGLQWLFDLPEVMCVLSGMNDIRQVRENCDIADTALAGSLGFDEDAVYDRVIEQIRKVEKIPCTGCGYCMPCVKGIDIPTCFRNYNTKYAEGWYEGLYEHILHTALTRDPKSASLCIKCGKCAKHCPQHIDIPSQMEKVAKELEGPIYRIVKRFKGFIWKA